MVVGRYSNTPYIPQQVSRSLYQDVSILSEALPPPISARQAASVPANSFLQDWGAATLWGGGREAGNVLPFPRYSLGEFTGGTPPFWSDFSVGPHISPSSTSRIGHPDGGVSGYHPVRTQAEEGSGYQPAIKLLQDANQAWAQLEYELIQEKQELAERYRQKQAKQTRRHTEQWAQMIDQTKATFQEVFSKVSLTEAVKLLPWCISVAVPFHYISRAETTAAQQDKGIPLHLSLSLSLVAHWFQALLVV